MILTTLMLGTHKIKNHQITKTYPDNNGKVKNIEGQQ